MQEEGLNLPITVNIRTIEDIKRFKSKLTSINIQLFEFQAITIRRLAEQIIMKAVRQKMHSAKFSKKIIDGTKLDNIEFVDNKKIRLHFRSEYFSEDGTHFDVAFAREEGTRRHFIKPVKKLALYGGPKWPFFSKGHWVDGLVSYYIVRDTVKSLTSNLQEAYNLEQKKWYEENLKGVSFAS